MSNSEDKKPTPKPEMVPMMSKITEDKLTSPNYLEWSKTVKPGKNSIFLKNGKTVIATIVQVENVEFF